MKDLYLQSFVVPVCRMNNVTKNIEHLYGSAFFIDCPGVFVTAKHVYEDMLEDKKKAQNHFYGLCVKDKNDKNVVALIEEGMVESPAGQIDIAVGKVQYNSDSPIKLAKESLYFMQEVWTCGYALTSSEIENPYEQVCWMDLRGQKGFVNRETRSKAMELRGWGNSAQLSFRIDSGLSGAPLFIDNDYRVGGVCTGVHTVGLYEYRIGEDEKVLRHTEYGMACMSSSFANWTPSFLKNEQ